MSIRLLAYLGARKMSLVPAAPEGPIWEYFPDNEGGCPYLCL